MNLDKIKEDISADWQSYQRMLESGLISDCELLNSINTNILSNKGKQLRPLLSILAGNSCGKSNNLTLSCAVVSEMIHTATLLHDDVADNASKRRGKATIQKLFTPAASVLTGDYWLSKALSLLTKECDYKVLSFFTRAVEELSEGELFQMQKAGQLNTTKSEYYSIIARKTSSLFVAAVTSAVYSVGANDETISEMEKYAYYLGLAFQIRDDIFDYMPELNTGKMSGSDIKEKKLTLPLILAMEKANSEESSSLLDVVKNSNEITDEIVAMVLEFVQKYDGIEFAQKELINYSELAIDALKKIPASKYRDHLESLAIYVGKRVN